MSSIRCKWVSTSALRQQILLFSLCRWNLLLWLRDRGGGIWAKFQQLTLFYFPNQYQEKNFLGFFSDFFSVISWLSSRRVCRSCESLMFAATVGLVICLKFLTGISYPFQVSKWEGLFLAAGGSLSQGFKLLKLLKFALQI